MKFNWDASTFFKQLLAENKLAQEYGFRFCSVSSLDGFEEALGNMQSTRAFLCVSDTANGYTELNHSPHTRRVKTVFLALRHRLEDMDARAKAFDVLREIFRQILSKIILEKTKLEQECIYLDPRIDFSEIPQYFFSGCACAHFTLAIQVYTDLRYNPDEWTSTH